MKRAASNARFSGSGSAQFPKAQPDCGWPGPGSSQGRPNKRMVWPTATAKSYSKDQANPKPRQSGRVRGRPPKLIDGYIAQHGIDAPRQNLPVMRDGYDQELVTDLDLPAAGIATVIWANGFK